MALRSGFFNAFLVNGNYDRKYNAEDYSDNIGAIIKTGVLRDGNNGFRVTANGLTLTVSAGRAWIEGHWVTLDVPYSFDAIVPPVGDYSRIDSVVLRLNTNEEARTVELAHITGTTGSTPVAPIPTRQNVRDGGIYEIVLAHVKVTPAATSVTVSDTRPNKNLCGWITSPVGYDDYFTALDDASVEHLGRIDDEWKTMKDRWASVTMFREYTWRTVLTAETSTVTFNIPQYDPTGVDVVNVYVNGLLEVENVDYTLSGSTITFITDGGGFGVKVAGTEIVVICKKSIDGTGLGSVADKVDELTNTVSLLSDTNEYVYICNGKNDNVLLSQIAQTWLDGGTDYGCKIIRVYGTFGATAAYAGAGTSASPYRWLSLGSGTAKNRRIIFDFSACSEIKITCADSTYNVILYGYNVEIIGANVIATGGAAIYMFTPSSNIPANVEKCRLWVTSQNGFIARGGTFRDCRVSLTTTISDAFCFNVLADGLLRLIGGEYYAYSSSSYSSAVVYVAAAQTGAVVITNAINCPTVTRTGYVQTYAVNCLTGDACCSFTDTVTNLSISATGQNIRGTLKVSKAGLM